MGLKDSNAKALKQRKQRPQPRPQFFCLLFRLAPWPQTLTCHGLHHGNSILVFSASLSLASSASPKPETCLFWLSLVATHSAPCNHNYLSGQHMDMWTVSFVNKTFFFQKINNYSSTVQLWPNATSVDVLFYLMTPRTMFSSDKGCIEPQF